MCISLQQQNSFATNKRRIRGGDRVKLSNTQRETVPSIQRHPVTHKQEYERYTIAFNKLTTIAPEYQIQNL